MATRLITITELPVGLAEAKFRLRIDDTGVPAVDEAADAEIKAMIQAATQLAESLTRRAISRSTYRLTLDAFPSEIRLLHPPIQSVTEVAYTAPDGTQMVVPAASYYLDSESEPGWIIPAADATWPETAASANAVRVTYSAGYGADCPPAIKQFVLLHVGHMYRNREAVTDKPMSVLPYGERMLDSFKLWEV